MLFAISVILLHISKILEIGTIMSVILMCVINAIRNFNIIIIIIIIQYII